MNLRLVGFTAAVVISAASAHAQQISGNELYEACRSDNAAMAGFCIGYLVGQVEGQSFGAYAAMRELAGISENSAANQMIGDVVGYCVPAAASNEQLRDVVVQYLNGHPETRHQSARILTMFAFAETFPCEKH